MGKGRIKEKKWREDEESEREGNIPLDSRERNELKCREREREKRQVRWLNRQRSKSLLITLDHYWHRKEKDRERQAEERDIVDQEQSVVTLMYERARNRRAHREPEGERLEVTVINGKS